MALAMLILGLAVGLVLLVSLSLVLGFCLGSEHWQSRLVRTRMEAVEAERRLHDLTRQAFVAMAERAEQHRSQ